MEELANSLLNYLLTTPYGGHVSLIVFVMFVLNQALPFVPSSITTKIPNWVMVLINVIAGRYKRDKTDIKGNVK